ncbi:MAG: GtrA family protein [Desulfovibrio sp.]|nr:GtrA family protein [Desulfovibrio sp.]
MFLKLLKFLARLYVEGWERSKAFLWALLRDKRVRFAIVGAAATVVYFLFGLLFVNVWQWHTMLGNTCAYLLGFVVSYSGQAFWTFEARGNHLVMLGKFAFTQLAGLGLNSCVVSLATLFGAHYIIAMTIAICVVPVFVYLVSRYWVFRKKDQGEASE